MSDEQIQSERPQPPDITERRRPLAEERRYADSELPSLGGSDLPKLGSLAQAARTKHLKQARNTLFILGAIITIGYALFLVKDWSDVEGQIQQQGKVAAVQAQQASMILKVFLLIIYGSSIAIGLLFLLFGFFVERYPVPILIVALILYIGLQLFWGALALYSGNWQAFLNYGIVFRVLIVFGLWKALQAAFAAQKEAREMAMAAEYGA